MPRSVQKTSELTRILALPKRKVDVDALIEPLSAWLRKDHVCGPGCAGGVTKLRGLQATALAEAHDNGGLFLVGPIGCGKTAVSLLAGTVFSAQRTLLIVPGGLLEKTAEDYKSLEEHWRLAPITVESYEKLSRPEHDEFLFNFRPDLIVLDEAHKAKSKRAAIRRRLERFLKKHRVPVLIMSGTPAKRSIRDFAHTMAWALGVKSPLPVVSGDIDDWAMALDAGLREDQRFEPGCLYAFGSDLTRIRRGLRDRIFATPGCLCSESSDLAVPLRLSIKNLPLTQQEDEPYYLLRNDWTTPDGHTFSDAVEMWRHARELAVGFYGVWAPRPPETWLSARKDWHAAVREYLSRSKRLDTERQVRDEVARVPNHKLGRFLARWLAVRDTFEPVSVPRWVGDTALVNAAEWLQGGGVAWVEHIPFGRRLSEMTGLPFFGEAGRTEDGDLSILYYQGKSAISSYANATGFNLQRWNRGLLTSIKGTGTLWDQTMGRFHRPGQLAHEVAFEMPVSCREQLEGFERAKNEDAPFHSDLLKVPSKLLTAAITSDRLTQRGWAWRKAA